MAEALLITRSGTHALNALAMLSTLPDGARAGAARIARQIKAPSNYLGKLLRTLSRAGVVESRKGSDGGFRLARGAGAISLIDVLDPIEHVSLRTGCILGRAKCPAANPCTVHEAWSRVREHYLGFLRSTTLADLAARKAPGGLRKGGKLDRAARTAAGGVR
jgi:Rrf2 family iron-sulfur cluster assembly transcriptional regulator